MTIPTPQTLAESLLDLGGGFTETVEDPNVPLGTHITLQAKRILDRVRADDPRLASFAGQTDATGYVWIAAHTFDFLIQAMNESWSFERWFTALAEQVAEMEPLPDDYFAELSSARKQVEAMAKQGFTCTARRDGGLIFTRESTR